MKNFNVDPVKTAPLSEKAFELRLELPWMLDKIRRNIGYRAEILDLGNGSGLISENLARAEHRVTSIDYRKGSAYQIPFPAQRFDVVTAIDLLEYVSEPRQVLAEAVRVLRPGGLLIYNDWNKNVLTWFLAMAFRGAHAYAQFMSPQKLNDLLDDVGMEVLQTCGVRPVILQKALFSLLRTGLVDNKFKYCFSKSLTISYIGCAKKLKEH